MGFYDKIGVRNLNSVITAIEPGTTKITVLICRQDDNGSLEAIGLGNSAFDGDYSFSPASVDRLQSSLDKALGQAQNMAGIKVKSCLLGIPNEFCGLVRNRKEIPLKGPVARQEVTELRRLVAAYSLPAPWRISKAIDGAFILDGSSIGNPLGMEGDILGLNTSLICYHSDFVRQMTRLLTSFGLPVDQAVPVPLAYGEGMLTPQEKQAGAVMVDIGGQSTDIAVYQDGVPVYFDWLPIGGSTITQDIAKGTGVSPVEAEKLKRYCVLGLAPSGESYIHNIPQDFLHEIVEARIEELLQMIKDKLVDEEFNLDKLSVVCAGGGISLFRGVKEFASGILEMPLRLGVPDVMGIATPIFSAAYSLACCTDNENKPNRLSFAAQLQKLFKSLLLKF